MNIPKFNCQRCGKCCKDWGYSERTNLNAPLMKGKLILLSKPTLSIHTWEKDLFSEENINPGWVFFDIKNDKTIVMNYNLKEGIICPNYNKEKGCLIYNKRPLICKSFPYTASEEIKSGKMDFNLPSGFGFCPEGKLVMQN